MRASDATSRPAPSRVRIHSRPSTITAPFRWFCARCSIMACASIRTIPRAPTPRRFARRGPIIRSCSIDMKTAIVTGAAGDIGAAIARVLAAADYTVGMLDLEEARVRDAVASVPGAVPLVANVADEASVEAALTTFEATPD